MGERMSNPKPVTLHLSLPIPPSINAQYVVVGNRKRVLNAIARNTAGLVQATRRMRTSYRGGVPATGKPRQPRIPPRRARTTLTCLEKGDILGEIPRKDLWLRRS